MTDLQNGLPSGWDRKWDENAGKYYYVDHATKTTTWEDPRKKSRSSGTSKQFSKAQVEHIPLHGSPDYKRNYVYPSQSTPIQAFQMHSKSIPLQEMRSATKSPVKLKNSTVQESSFTSPAYSSTDSAEDSVAKISAMFPTVSETHIKLLLKNCRYMKSIFPNADETIILECLQNNESSIQKTSEILKEMGYSKKETVKIATPKVEPKIVKDDEVEAGSDKDKTPIATVQIKTKEEKNQMKIKLQELYKDVPEHLIAIALESVNFNENRANQILQIMKQEDNETQNIKNQKPEEDFEKVDSPLPSTSQIPISQSRQSIKSILKSERKEDATSFSRIIDGNNKSANLTNTLGHNINFSKGPNENLLLDNYVQWQGSNKSFQKGPQSLAKGPNKNLISTKYYSPCGPNADFRRGPSFGLSKGSIFRQMLVNLE